MNLATIWVAMLAGVAVCLPGCASSDAPNSPALAMTSENRPVAPSDDSVKPLEQGQRAPSATLLTPAGDRFDVGDAYRNHPTVLIFYRGGWCPYCNTHLADLAQVEPTLRELGFAVLAVSPDQPAKLRESINEHGFSYQLLSDQDMSLARAFGIAFKVDDDTVQRYKSYNIDLNAASGRSHFELPVPAVYLIDRQGVIQFVHWDADYKQRMSGEALLATAREVVNR